MCIRDRHIDDIMEKETTIQNQLKQALDEARLSNEIISAIAKSYCSIYRIDVQKDFFEEISNDSEIHKPVSYTHLDVYKRQAGRRLLGQSLCGLYTCLQVLLCFFYEALYRAQGGMGHFP